MVFGEAKMVLARGPSLTTLINQSLTPASAGVFCVGGTFLSWDQPRPQSLKRQIRAVPLAQLCQVKPAAVAAVALAEIAERANRNRTAGAGAVGREACCRPCSLFVLGMLTAPAAGVKERRHDGEAHRENLHPPHEERWFGGRSASGSADRRLTRASTIMAVDWRDFGRLFHHATPGHERLPES
jgi:hypothetical protein